MEPCQGGLPDHRGCSVDYYRFKNATIGADLQAKLDWADTYIINSEISSTSRFSGNHWLYAMPTKLCDYAAANGKTAIISSVDKPYDVQMYANANAIVAAYGCKGSSVDPTEALIGGATGSAAAYGPNIIAAVEVILGTFEAQGKLPVNIPVYDFEANTYTDTIAYERGHGLTYEAKEVTEHVMPWTVVKEATCTEAGLETGVCAHGFTAEREIPALGHNYENGTCTNCGDVLVTFTDVPADSFYYAPVAWAVAKGITNGVTEDTFAPNRNVTRAEVVTFLWRAAGSPVVEGTNPFTDIAETDFYYNAVLWAVANGITTGKSETTFAPMATCTRAETVTFLWRGAGKPEATGTENFADVNDGDFFQSAVIWAVENVITNGIDANNFGSYNICNRAHIVTFLYRAQ